MTRLLRLQQEYIRALCEMRHLDAQLLRERLNQEQQNRSRWFATPDMGDPFDVETHKVRPNTVDGLTHEQIRDHFRFRKMATDINPGKLASKPLTPAQLAWARADWSAQLRAKVQATKKRERNAITCEPNYVDE